MFGSKKQPSADHVIGAGMQVIGDCTFQGTLQIEGTMVGSVTAEEGAPSAVVVGPSAQIEGAIEADRVIIAGTVIGPVAAAESLELRSTARIQGNVRYKTMEMQPGATVAGAFQPQTMPPPERPQSSASNAAPPAAEPAEPTLEPDRPLQAEMDYDETDLQHNGR